jgi:hypothetical protein
LEPNSVELLQRIPNHFYQTQNFEQKSTSPKMSSYPPPSPTSIIRQLHTWINIMATSVGCPLNLILVVLIVKKTPGTMRVYSKVASGKLN